MKPDLAEILRIELELFVNPYDEEQLTNLLRRRNTIAYVIEDTGGYVVGYMIHRVCSRIYTIERLCVQPSHQRLGYGTGLMRTLKAKLSTIRRAIGVKIHERALPAQLFLKAHGFTCIGTEDADDGSGDDIYLFEFDKYRDQ